MQIRENQDLRAHTTMKVPVTARYFCITATRDELAEAVRYAYDRKIRYVILGGGSNLVFVEPTYDGLVVKHTEMTITETPVDDTFADVTVSSGYPMTAFVQYTIEHGLEGMEYQMGLPGSVGGAVYMNSKWTKPLRYVGDTLISASLITPSGELKKVDREYFRFAYDYSVLQDTHEIVIEATFRMRKSNPELLRTRAAEAQDHRRRTQPSGVFTSGCFFQNLSEQDMSKIGTDSPSAGRLIDQAGLKGAREGAFVVSTLHANFIVHEGGGDPRDLRKLLDRIKSTVHDTYHIDLKEEVRVIDN